MLACEDTNGGRITSHTATRGCRDYHCPSCGGAVFFKPCADSTITPHFAHHNKTCGYGKESTHHRNAKAFMGDLMARMGYTVDYEVPIRGTDWDRRADVVARSTGKPIVIEVQHSNITTDEITERMRDYNNAGYNVMWVYVTGGHKKQPEWVRRIANLNDWLLQLDGTLTSHDYSRKGAPRPTALPSASPRTDLIVTELKGLASLAPKQPPFTPGAPKDWLLGWLKSVKQELTAERVQWLTTINESIYKKGPWSLPKVVTHIVKGGTGKFEVVTDWTGTPVRVDRQLNDYIPETDKAYIIKMLMIYIRELTPWCGVRAQLGESELDRVAGDIQTLRKISFNRWVGEYNEAAVKVAQTNREVLKWFNKRAQRQGVEPKNSTRKNPFAGT